MKRHLFTRLVKSGLTFLLVLIVMNSLSGAAFAFKAPDSAPESGMQAVTSAEQTGRPAGLTSVRAGNHGKSVAADPEQGAIESIDHLMKAAGSKAVKKTIQHDKLGYKHVRLLQYYKGLPVVGSEVVVHINKENVVYLIQGDYLPSINVSTEPSVSATAALQIGLDELSGKPGLRVTGEPTLVIYGSQLAYHYVLSHEGNEVGQWWYYVDAHTGNLIFRFNNIKSAAPTGNGSHVSVTGNRLTGEDGSTVTITGWKETTGNYYLYNYDLHWGVYDVDAFDWEQQASSSWGTADRAAVSLANNLSLTQNWVSTVLGRNSFNNAGAFAQGDVHYGTNLVNAYWDGTKFLFGDGDGAQANALTTLDIAAHEYGHAITQYTSNLTYSYESGALNESYSDITGALVEFASQPDGRASYPSKTPGAADWLEGEDCWLSDTALRDMRDPQRYQQPSYYKGTYWYTGSGDYGGVHTNSGVQNFAFYLLAEGGTGTNDGHSYSITGIGITAAGEVAMRANMFYLTPSSQYAASRTGWIQAATDLGYSTTTVEDVWTAVGVGGSSSCNQITRSITPPAVTTVAPGGVLGPFTVTETNNCSTDVQFYVQWYVTKPDGNTVWLTQRTASLAAGQTLTHEQNLSIPSTSVLGNFVFGILATDTAGNQIDNDYFSFTVQ
jgi:Zn-dependent metalloprotease